MHAIISKVFIVLNVRDASESKYPSIVFLSIFYLPTLNIICFVQKNYIFLRFCLCFLSFESDTVKRDCPVQIFRKI